jgi:tricorn protease-like protein
MLLGVRTYGGGTAPATILIDNDQVYRIDSKFGYSSWHPSGKLVTYSINNLPMFFHTRSTRNEIRDTIDLDSAMAYYLIDAKVIKTSPKLSKKERLENWPAWSSDGKYLYFCSAPMLWPKGRGLHDFPPKEYKQVRYDLVRISYDIKNDIWGEQETVLSTQDAGGLSIAMPHISPDGRWLLFCMLDYGFFPSWQKDSDLYMIDLKKAEQTGKYEYRRLEINSDQSEAWQSWSTNSRWLVFSSKRSFGKFTKLYYSYVDTSGKVYKPILLPQKDPVFYNWCLTTYTNPEFVIAPIKHVKGELAKAYRGTDMIKVDMPITMATIKAGSTSEQVPPWGQQQIE